MHTLPLCIIAICAAVPAAAQEATNAAAVPASTVEAEPVDQWREEPTLQFAATEVDLEAFKWIARPVIVFAESEFVPAFQQQMELLSSRADQLAKRDVVVITDTVPEAESDIRRRFRPNGFMLALVGKDGKIKLRKPFPRDVREITRTIDKMPMRLQEIREENESDR